MEENMNISSVLDALPANIAKLNATNADKIQKGTGRFLQGEPYVEMKRPMSIFSEGSHDRQVPSLQKLVDMVYPADEEQEALAALTHRTGSMSVLDGEKRREKLMRDLLNDEAYLIEAGAGPKTLAFKAAMPFLLLSPGRFDACAPPDVLALVAGYVNRRCRIAPVDLSERP